jgi:hypothetical protein
MALEERLQQLGDERRADHQRLSDERAAAEMQRPQLLREAEILQQAEVAAAKAEQQKLLRGEACYRAREYRSRAAISRQIFEGHV